MDSERDACFDDERLVLSEVHIGSNSAADGEAEVVSRYTYLVPSDQTNDDDNSSSSSSDSDSESEGGTRGRGSGGSCSSPTRCRKRPRSEASSAATSQQRRSRPAHEVLTIVHRMATPLGLVGQQVWSAAFLLGDFVLTHPRIFADMQVLELGAGPGVAGLIAARVARRCYLTDYHNEVLKLLARNVEANLHLFAQDGCAPTSGNSIAAAAVERAMLDDDGDIDSDNNNCAGSAGSTEERNMIGRDRHGGDRPGQVAAVRELDWFTFSKEEGPTDNAICPQVREREKGDLRALSNGEDAQKASTIKENGDTDDAQSGDDDVSFDWREGELERLSSPLPSETGEPKPLVILAADVIYDEGLTEAFFDVLKLLMPPPPPPPVSPSGRPRQSAPPPSHGNDEDRSCQDGASLGANGGARDLTTKETGRERSRGLSRSISVDVSEDNEKLSSTQRQGCASSAASLDNSNNNVDAQTDSKCQEREEPPTEKGQTYSRFGAGGGHGAVLYLALEKRFNFSLAELSVSATGYRALLRNVMDVTDEVDRQAARACKLGRKAFEGTRLPLAFQQCFRYNRSDAMEIWEIRRRPVS